MRMFLIALTTAMFLGLTGTALAAQNYFDSQGDSGTAPDILGLTIDNDNEGGFSFNMQIANRTDFVVNDLYIIHLDTDQDATTGGLDGAEYEIVANRDAQTNMVGAEARKWNSAIQNWDHLDTPIAIGWSDGPLFGLTFRDFGLDYGDSFNVVISDGVVGSNPPQRDAAPEEDSQPTPPWTYTIQHVSICQVDGTDADDLMLGTSMPDWLCGFGGNDIIRGFEDNDRLSGGAGKDRINGSVGDDRIKGGGGKDKLKGGFGDDRIKGGGKRDVIRAGGGNDIVKAGKGNDKIYARDGEADLIKCGKGHRDRVVTLDRQDVFRRCEFVGAD